MADREDEPKGRGRSRDQEGTGVDWAAWGDESPEELYWQSQELDDPYWRGGEPYEPYERAGGGRLRSGAPPLGDTFSEEESGDSWSQFFAPAVDEPYGMEESEAPYRPYGDEDRVGDFHPYGGDRFWYGRESHPGFYEDHVAHGYEYGQLYGYAQRQFGHRRDSYYATANRALPGLGRGEAPRWRRRLAAPAPTFRGRGPRGYTRSDERICEEVVRLLTDAPWLDPRDIEVRVEGGEVFLEGSVDNRQSARAAEVLAAEVMGVRDVHNRLRRRGSGAGLGAESEPRRRQDPPR
jgi:hypothetical protein